MDLGSRAAALGRALLSEASPRGRAAKGAVVWSVFAALLALAALPVFSSVLPPLVDYPNHLARMHLLAEGGNAFYAVRWAPIPDLAEDLIVPPLSSLIPLMLAGKLFLLAIFALQAGGVLWLNRLAHGDWRLWPLVGFLLLYSRTFLWGFENYLFGLGLALCGAALWLALEEKPRALRIAISACVAIAVYFSHLEAFIVYALLILGLETMPAIADFSRRAWWALAARIAVAAPQFFLPAGFFFFRWLNSVPGTIRFAAPWRKADLLFTAFDNYSRPFDIVCFVLFAGTLLLLAARRRLALSPRLGPACALVFAAFLLAPSQLYGGSGIDHRLPIAFFLALIAATAPRLPSRRAARVVAIGAGLMLALRFAVIEGVWRAADPAYRADLAAIEQLPRGAKIALAYPADATDFTAIPQLHVATLAVARRGAFVPTLFAMPGQQPIAMRPPYRALAGTTSPRDLWRAFVDRDREDAVRVAGVLAHYDYLAFVATRPFGAPKGACLQPLFRSPEFDLFQIVEGCAAG